MRKEVYDRRKETFYNSKAWKDCRESYKKIAGGLCERCKAQGIIRAGEIVHHIKPITQDNMRDPQITLNYDNLQLLCRECHAEVHKKRQRRWTIDPATGKVTALL